jgi:adenylate cyclase
MASTIETGEGRTLEEAFAKEARRGVRLAAIARTVAFMLLWASYYEDALGKWNPYLVYRSELIGAALASGLLTLVAAQRSKRPVAWCAAFLVVDLIVIVLLAFGWLPEAISDYPQFLAVRMQDIMLFTVILCASALPLSPRLVGAAGIGAAALWVAAVLRSFWMTPDATTADAVAKGATGWNDLLARISKALVLDTDYLLIQTALLLAIAALLVLGVRQGRRMVVLAVRAEAGRARFARFFPPGVLAALGSDGRVPSRRSDACILFADFDRSAAPGLEALGRYYAAAEAVVLDEGGVIDRFVGDPVMASFGAIEEAGLAPPAERALRCAERLVALEGMQVAAVHRGAVVSGEVGSVRQRAFGVVGDTVNVTRRLLDWAREHGLALAASGPLVEALPDKTGLARQEDAALRGLDTPLAAWSRT